MQLYIVSDPGRVPHSLNDNFNLNETEKNKQETSSLKGKDRSPESKVPRSNPISKNI